MTEELVFEYPLNERVRTFLRLEHLLAKAEHYGGQDGQWAMRSALEALLDVATIASRVDIKNELLRELERHSASLNRIRSQAGVHAETLDRILSQLGEASDALRGLNGPIAQRLRDDELLKCVGQRTAIPGGTCSFDLPLYHRWLAQPTATRGEQLSRWLEDVRPASAAIGLILSLTRDSAVPRPVMAVQGFFQQALDQQVPAQMLRVGINGDAAIYPEISGHKNRFSIRFMAVSPGAKPSQHRDDVAFQLTCCVL